MTRRLITSADWSLQATTIQLMAPSAIPQTTALASKKNYVKLVKYGKTNFSQILERFSTYTNEEGLELLQRDVILCQIFIKNEAKVLQMTGGVFITVPFQSFKQALAKKGKLQKHEHSSAHTISEELENLRRQAMKNLIHTQIIQQSNSEKKLNRRGLMILLRGLYYLVKEEIAHTTKYGSLIENILDNMNGEFQT
ncbi:hypothetical protein FQA39_LY11082 [Lamprigera yunnana]|nr:hypothetical protein FQA39_LY11082 [Lamprigera yunnana]